MLKKIILFPFTLLFFILRHPLTLIIATIYWYMIVLKEGSLYSFSFSNSSPPLTDAEFILVIAVFALYGLAVGSHIVKRALRYAAFPLLAVSIVSAGVLFWYVETTINSDKPSLFLYATAILLMFISAGTAVDTTVSYLASRRPGPLFLPGMRGARRIGRAAGSAARWIRSHRLIVGLIILQVAFNVFVLYRLSDIELRTGGSLFTMCNADKSITSIQQSIVRIAGEEGEGTGMIVREDGYILTNAHVIAEDPAPKIIFSDYSFKTSKVMYRDQDKDIAVLKVDGAGYAPVTFIDPIELSPRNVLYSVGFPMGTAIRGDATVANYVFVAVRSIKDFPTDMVQLSGVGTEGSSGAPVITSCGQVAGMFTAGTEGISLAVSSTSIQDTIGFLSEAQSTWPEPPEFALEPDKSAEEAIRAFYAFIKMRDFKRAYLMLTPDRVKDTPLEEWIKGYTKTLDVTLVDMTKETNTPVPSPTISQSEKSASILQKERVYVRLRSLDLEGQDIAVKYFEGTWIVVHDGEFWRLSDSNIQPVPEPGWDWFW